MSVPVYLGADVLVAKTGPSHQTRFRHYTLTTVIFLVETNIFSSIQIGAAIIMEYLTLHDIPQRHYNPTHSHRMASQPSERPMAQMAAVCEIFSFDTPPYLPKKSLCSFLPTPLGQTSSWRASLVVGRKHHSTFL